SMNCFLMKSISAMVSPRRVYLGGGHIATAPGHDRLFHRCQSTTLGTVAAQDRSYPQAKNTRRSCSPARDSTESGLPTAIEVMQLVVRQALNATVHSTRRRLLLLLI